MALAVQDLRPVRLQTDDVPAAASGDAAGSSRSGGSTGLGGTGFTGTTGFGLGLFDHLAQFGGQRSRIRLSLEMLRGNDQIIKLLKRVAERNGIQKTARTAAEPLTDDDLQDHVQLLKEVNLAEIWNAFLASSYNLFDFILRYDYKVKHNIEDSKVCIFQELIEFRQLLSG